MPHLAEQNARRPFAASAQRASVVPAQVKNSPRVLVISGPSGVGKRTLTRSLMQRLPCLWLAVSATTRPPRAGEVDGRDYRFLSCEEFQRRAAAGEFLEYTTYAGHCYGTLNSELERPGAGVVLEIDLEGARSVRRFVSDAVAVFVAPPSFQALRQRLERRGLDSPEQIEQRLEVARGELAARSEFDHVIVNDRLEDAVSELTNLVATMWKLHPEGNVQ